MTIKGEWIKNPGLARTVASLDDAFALPMSLQFCVAFLDLKNSKYIDLNLNTFAPNIKHLIKYMHNTNIYKCNNIKYYFYII